MPIAIDRNRGLRALLPALIAVFVLTVGAGCITVSPGPDALTTINSAITSIDNAPGNFQAVLSDTIKQLHNAKQEYVDAVQGLLNDTGGLLTAGVQCNLDIVGLRVKDGLVFIRDHVILGKPAPPPTPWTCIISPDSITLTQSTPDGPWFLPANAPQQIKAWGINFYPQNLPQVDLFDKANNRVKAAVVRASRSTNYLITFNLQTVDFSQAQVGQYLSLHWSSASPGANSVNLILVPPQTPPPPQKSVQDFLVAVHANSGLVSGECKNIQDDPSGHYNVGSGWKIDRTRGDPLHPGIAELSVDDDVQAARSLRGYNYQPLDDQNLVVEGTICGAGAAGPGALFRHTYRVFLIHI